MSSKLSRESEGSGDSGKLRSSSGDVLSEIIALQCLRPVSKQKRRPALNTKVVCITDVLEDLRRKRVEKAEAKKEKKQRELRKNVKRKLNN